MTWVRETRKHQRVHHASRREGRLSTATKHHGTLCKEEEEFASWETREEDGVGEKKVGGSLGKVRGGSEKLTSAREGHFYL